MYMKENICFVFIIILLYKVLNINNKKNCYLYEYFNEITDIAINKQYDIFIIYYGFINPNNNWKDIIIGQFTDIKDSKIIFNNFYNVRLEIVLSSNSQDIIDEAVTITNDFFKNISYNKYNIITINDNLYEYPGILHLYKKGVATSNIKLDISL